VLPHITGQRGHEGITMTILQLLDYAGVAVFAATGALAASRRQMDMIGFIFLAIVTGVGGGTLRDLILGETPVFWVKEPNYLIVAAATAIIVYFTAHLVWSRYVWLLWLDAVGLSAYCVIGAAKGLALGVPAPIAVVTGVMTATFGGILRDIVRRAGRGERLHASQYLQRPSRCRDADLSPRRLSGQGRGAAFWLEIPGLPGSRRAHARAGERAK
jgi:Glycine transporter